MWWITFWIVISIVIILTIACIVILSYECARAEEIDGKEPFLWDDYNPYD